jgi:HSP20 family protein
MARELTKKQQNGAVAERTRNAAIYTPRFDIVETAGELMLYGDLPGVSKENLTIDFENGNLSVEGKVEPRHTGHDFVYGEYGIGDFRRNFTISEAIDSQKISAELRGGVLTLHLPKAEAVKPKRIAVKEGK